MHRMHTETLLNPFFTSDYATQDDGQDHSVFTSRQERKQDSSIRRKENDGDPTTPIKKMKK